MRQAGLGEKIEGLARLNPLTQQAAGTERQGIDDPRRFREALMTHGFQADRLVKTCRRVVQAF